MTRGAVAGAVAGCASSFCCSCYDEQGYGEVVIEGCGWRQAVHLQKPAPHGPTTAAIAKLMAACEQTGAGPPVMLWLADTCSFACSWP